MSKKIKEHIPLLHFLANGKKPKIKKAIIEDSSSELVDILCECAHNVLKGTVKLTPAQYKLLKRYKKELRILGDKKISRKRKRATIQKGGFLGALLRTILPTLIGVFDSLVTQ